MSGSSSGASGAASLAASTASAPSPDIVGIAADVLTEEYRVLRAEIGRYQDHQSQIMNFSFLVLTGTLAYVGALFNAPTGAAVRDRAVILLYLPMVFAVLAALYSDRSIRIVRMADYLTNFLRPKVSALVGIKVWQWEIYKRTASPVSPRIAYALDKVRWSVFILPVIGCSAFYFGVEHGPPSWPLYLGLAVSVLSLATIILVMHLSEETFGVTSRSASSLDLVDSVT